MRFCLIDAVLERSPEKVVALKRVSAAEEYLQDHFPTFPVLPGVMMLEALTQAARLALSESDPNASRWMLGGVRAVKYGAMVRPGDSLRVEVSLLSRTPDAAEFKCTGEALPASGGEPRNAVSGRLTLRPARAGAPRAGPAAG